MPNCWSNFAQMEQMRGTWSLTAHLLILSPHGFPPWLPSHWLWHHGKAPFTLCSCHAAKVWARCSTKFASSSPSPAKPSMSWAKWRFVIVLPPFTNNTTNHSNCLHTNHSVEKDESVVTYHWLVYYNTMISMIEWSFSMLSLTGLLQHYEGLVFQQAIISLTRLLQYCEGLVFRHATISLIGLLQHCEGLVFQHAITDWSFTTLWRTHLSTCYHITD